MSRVGIDLSPVRCALVDVRAAGRVPGRAGQADTGVCVHAFASIPYGAEGSEALTSELRALLAKKAVSRHAWVTLWGIRSSHQFMLLPPAKPSDLQALARREAKQSGSALQIDGGDASVGVAFGGTRETSQGVLKREVSFVAASSSDIRARLQPIIDAGFIVEGVVTPGEALCSLARLRRAPVPGEAHAYVAMTPFASTLAIIRDGLLLFSREIAWGYQGEHGKRYPTPLMGEELAQRLASELRRSFLFFKQSSKQEVTQVLLCGDVPEIRSLTAPLISLLGVEVETLDSLDGVDATALPQPAELLREQIVDLRLALALAADPAPAVNLLPGDLKARRVARRRQLVFGAGMAAAVVVSALLYGVADRQARTAERQAQSLEQQVAALEPRARQIEAGHEDAALESARRAALVALDTQGPRMARLLEALARLAPEEVTLRSLKVLPDGASWRFSMTGLATSADPARAQAAVTGFLRGLQESPYFGPPVRPPSLRIASGKRMPVPGAIASAAEQPGDAMQQLLAPGMSGIEFMVDFSVRK